jgi:hypothetical protein
MLCFTMHVSLFQLGNDSTIWRRSPEKTSFEHHRMKTELMGLLIEVFFIEKELTYEWKFMPRLAVLVCYQFIDDDHCGVAPPIYGGSLNPVPHAWRVYLQPSLI